MRLALVGVLILALTTPLLADAPASPGELFDPQRHMRVADVKPGMKGYGLSVFRGTKIERFEVEVLSVLKNFNPKYDVILIRCSGANLEHTGAISGMSGSPIFLEDDSGKARMIGAFAYGWAMVKDPVAGVQPIEYMLEIGRRRGTTVTAGQRGGAEKGIGSAAEPRSGFRWSMDELILPRKQSPRQRMMPAGYEPMEMSADPDLPRLEPLVTPLMAAGIPASLMEEIGPIFRAHGYSLLQAGGMGGGALPDGEAPRLEPGSVLAAPLMTGDIDMTAIGTCTEVIGNRVFGFGHSFNNEGDVSMPMGSGYINAVIANTRVSFKLGALSKLWGTLTADQTVGIAGSVGKTPATIPIELVVQYEDGRPDVTYNFNASRHPRMSPLLAGLATATAMSGVQDLPQYHTMEYELNLEFENGQHLKLSNIVVNTSPPDMFYQVSMPLLAAAENPFAGMLPRSMKGRLKVTPEARQAQILSINVPRLKYRPGETVAAYITYRPFRGPEAVMPVELKLPAKLPNGDYQMVISDWQRYLSDEQQSKPFRFTAESAEEVFAVLKDANSIKQNAIYIRLLNQADGVALGRTAMAQLPSSRRRVLLGAGRSNTSPFMSSVVKVVPTERVISGAAEFTIKVDSETRVEVAGERAEEEPPTPDAPSPSVQDAPPAPEAAPGPPSTPGPRPDQGPDDSPSPPQDAPGEPGESPAPAE